MAGTACGAPERGYFCVLPAVNKYRWVCRNESEKDRPLSGIRYAPAGAAWTPLAVKWIPQTIKRLPCDFPNFHAILNCMSIAVTDAIAPYLAGNVELLAFDGLDGKYIGVHCIRWIDAAILDGVDLSRTSIHDPAFIPTLMADSICGHDVFGVEGMVGKLFVSARVKSAIENGGFTGFVFHPVPLC